MVRPEGPVPARILICGEAPGVEEERIGVPFVGASGQELTRMLGEAGIMRSECFLTNVCRVRPANNDITEFIPLTKKAIRYGVHVPLKNRMVMPVVKQGYDLLLKEIELVRPNVIVAFGNTALWALTGNWGIQKWRGSHLRVDSAGGLLAPKLIPTYHPAAILRQWDWRATAVADLRRAARNAGSREYEEPQWRFIIRPSFPRAIETLERLTAELEAGPRFLEFDLETRTGHITCAGVSWSPVDAICLPFTCSHNTQGYWNEEEEVEIIWRLRTLLTHPNARVRGQNLLYDCQYTHKHWHFIPRVSQDTMISHHTAFCELPKRLDFQASLYCSHYVYWKHMAKADDRKEGA